MVKFFYYKYPSGRFPLKISSLVNKSLNSYYVKISLVYLANSLNIKQFVYISLLLDDCNKDEFVILLAY